MTPGESEGEGTEGTEGTEGEGKSNVATTASLVYQTLMPSRQAMSALPFLPRRLSLSALRTAAQGCRGCPLYRRATQAVFGEGRRGARIMLVGEQPGDAEDRAGHPFVGPSGRLLNEALEDAGISRKDAYVTNVVKHFKWTPAGRRRLHKRPSAREIAACAPWLEQEIEVVKPVVLVALGATAAQALLGRDFRVTRQHGQPLEFRPAAKAVATIHPSSVLRQRQAGDRRRALERMTEDLRIAARLL